MEILEHGLHYGFVIVNCSCFCKFKILKGECEIEVSYGDNIYTAKCPECGRTHTLYEEDFQTELSGKEKEVEL